MARFKRLHVLTKMEELGLLPIFYNGDAETARQIVSACYAGGALCIELTNRGDHAIDVFRQLDLHCKAELPDVVLGVGSVVDAPTAALYIAYGANFIVSPVLDGETAVLCNKHKIAYMPGCGSVTEIHNAEALGVEICKIFPGSQVGGPEFVKAITGPCPWTSILPTGGVEPTTESLSAWFTAGAVCVGMGSKLITKAILQQHDFRQLTENVRKTLGIIAEVRRK